MNEQVLIDTQQETVSQTLDVREYFGWGHQAHEHCNESFVVVTSKKGHPYPGCKGFRRIWRIGGVVIDKPILSKSDYEPVVGEVICTVQDEIIEIVSVDYI